MSLRPVFQPQTSHTPGCFRLPPCNAPMLCGFEFFFTAKLVYIKSIIYQRPKRSNSGQRMRHINVSQRDDLPRHTSASQHLSYPSRGTLLILNARPRALCLASFFKTYKTTHAICFGGPKSKISDQSAATFRTIQSFRSPEAFFIKADLKAIQ